MLLRLSNSFRISECIRSELKSGLCGWSMFRLSGLGWFRSSFLGLFRLGGVRLFGQFYLLARRQNCVQRGAFHPGMEFHDGTLADILNQPVDDLVPKLAMGHLAAAEAQRRLDLVAVVQKADGLVLLGLVVVLVHCDGELDFLDDDDLLLFARRPLALVFFVEEFAVILNAANRWDGVGRNLHQIQTALAGDLEGFKRWKNAELFAIFVNYANFTRAYPIVDADKLFRRTFIDGPPPNARDYASLREYNISLLFQEMMWMRQRLQAFLRLR